MLSLAAMDESGQSDTALPNESPTAADSTTTQTAEPTTGGEDVDATAVSEIDASGNAKEKSDAFVSLLFA